MPKNLTRRKFLATLGLAVAGSGLYVRVIEPRWLTIGRHTVKLGLKDSGPPLRILHLSDLHASQVVSLSFIGEAVQLGLSLKPGLICLTGDFITRGYKTLDGYAEVLKPLAANAPTFACLGNHDGGVWAARRRGHADTNRVREMLAKAGVTLLHNAAKTIRIRERDLRLVGLGDLWAGELQPMLAFDSPQPTTTDATIVLSHNPDSKEALKPYPWDLLLSGHTHGGQMRLPFIGAPFAPVRDKRFVEGLYRWSDRWIHVTRGVGNLYGVRFNCPPEVGLLTLV
ncbi:MAG: phosphodiesterase YaeI [Verrucomicrobia bacterium]|nr:phosphodiesterase YaeI [Verrucomicrobiota bacterium]